MSIKAVTLFVLLLVDCFRGFAFRLAFFDSPRVELDLEPFDLFVESYLPDSALKRLDLLLLLSSLLL